MAMRFRDLFNGQHMFLRGFLTQMGKAEQWGIVRDLLDKDANPNDQDEFGDSAFFEAARRGRIDIVRLFINYNVDINLGCKRGKSALHGAISQRESEVARYLIEKGARVDVDGLVTAAVLAGDIDILRLLLEKGANAKEAGKNKRTALMLAVLYDRTDMIELLLDYGAKVDAKDKAGDTALDLAFKEGMARTAKFLIERGASMEGVGRALLFEFSILIFTKLYNIYQQSDKIRAEYLQRQAQEQEEKKAAAQLKAQEEARFH